MSLGSKPDRTGARCDAASAPNPASGTFPGGPEARAYEQVSAELEAQILDGRLRPGERLPGEIELAARFGVHRSTIRESLRRLESEGLVTRPSPRKLVVSLPRSRDLASRNSRALRLQEVTVDDLWTVSVVTEPLAAELAARNARADDLDRLDDNQARMERAMAAGDQARIVALDTDFHRLVAEAAHNPALSLAHEPIGVLLYSGMAQLLPHLPQAPARQLEAHGRVLAAIRQGDVETARDWMRRHMVDFRRGFLMAGLSLDAPVAPLAPSMREAAR